MAQLASGLTDGDLCYIPSRQMPARIKQVTGRGGGPNVLLELPDGSETREYGGFIEPLEFQIALFKKRLADIQAFKEKLRNNVDSE